MNVKRVTLLDVAQRAGVSRTTASFVLTGRRDMRISADAQERVLQASRELNYRPNLLARSLRTNMSLTIGFISDVIASDAFAGAAVRGSLATALHHGHLLFVGETGGDPEVEKQLVQAMLDRGVGGLVYASQYTRQTTPSKLLRANSVVLMNCLARGRTLPAVIPDEEAAGRAAVQTLLDAGHRDGIYVVGETPDHILAAQRRRAGIQQVLDEATLTLAGTIDTIWWPRAAFAAVTTVLHGGARPKALICLNDRVALGAYQALAAHRLSVPGDVSIISFDDSDLAGWLEPPLTSIAIPHFEMGRRAVELLLTPDAVPTVHVEPMIVRERGSIGPPAHTRSKRVRPTATPADPPG